MFDVRQLGPIDAATFRALRLESLRLHPEAFGSSHETELKFSIDKFSKRLENITVFAGFLGPEIVGIAGFNSHHAVKLHHKGVLWGMYVREAARGSALATMLLNAIVDHARGEVEYLQLTVVTSNKRACRFYERGGFVRYGVEPDALKVEGRYHDEALMMMRFDSDNSNARS